MGFPQFFLQDDSATTTCLPHRCKATRNTGDSAADIAFCLRSWRGKRDTAKLNNLRNMCLHFPSSISRARERHLHTYHVCPCVRRNPPTHLRVRKRNDAGKSFQMLTRKQKDDSDTASRAERIRGESAMGVSVCNDMHGFLRCTYSTPSSLQAENCLLKMTEPSILAYMEGAIVRADEVRRKSEKKEKRAPSIPASRPRLRQSCEHSQRPTDKSLESPSSCPSSGTRNTCPFSSP